MSFLQKLKERKAERVEHEPVEGGIPTLAGCNLDKQIGYEFETTYVQEPRYEGGQDELVKDEERVITDRKHSEKALEKIFKNHVTFKDYITSLIWRIKQ